MANELHAFLSPFLQKPEVPGMAPPERQCGAGCQLGRAPCFPPHRPPNGNGSAGQARPLPLDCFLQLRAQRPGASALCAVCAKPLSSLRASLLGARDGAGRQPGPRAQRGAPVTWTEHEATPWATSFPAPQHWQERQASPGSHRRCGTLHGKSKSNGKLVTVCRPNGAS